MPEPETPYDFLSHAAALEVGLTKRFWHQAYIQFLMEAESDTSIPLFDRYVVARTVRIRFCQETIDVLVRCQPDPREYRIVRLTAFTATLGWQTLKTSQAYKLLGEDSAVLGEAALLDTGRRW